MATSKTIVRNYKGEDDLPGILELYDFVLDKTCSFARDERFWRHFIRYPGVSDDSIFIAEENNKIKGLAIAAITNIGKLRQGDILELQATDSLSAGLLVAAALDYLDGKAPDMIRVISPPYLNMGKLFVDWLKFETGAMMCRPLSILPLLKALADDEKIKSSYSGKAILFVFDSEIIRLEISDESVEATRLDELPDKPALSTAMSSATFLKIVFGEANPYVACLTRRVRVRGWRNMPKVLKLLRSMRLDGPWSIALVDRM